jgi:hypothetical protein
MKPWINAYYEDRWYFAFHPEGQPSPETESREMTLDAIDRLYSLYPDATLTTQNGEEPEDWYSLQLYVARQHSGSIEEAAAIVAAHGALPIDEHERTRQ